LGSADRNRVAVLEIGLAAFAGALLVAIYDLALAAWTADPSTASVPRLLWFTPLLVVAAPSTLALLTAGAARLEAAARARLGERRWIGWSFDLVLASPLVALVPGLFSGPSIGSSPWRWPAVAAATIAAVGWARLLRFSTSRLAAWAAGSDSARRSSPAAVAALLAAGIGVPHWATTSILPGLYDGFHQGLSLIAVMVCSASVFAIIRARARRLPGRRALIAAALAAVLGWPLGAIATHDEPLARQLLADRAPFWGAFSEQLFTVSRLFAFDRGGAGPESAAARGSGLADARFTDGSPRRDALLITVDALRGDALDPSGRLSDSTESLRAATARGLRYSRAYSPSNYTPYSIPGLMLGYVPAAGDEPAEAETIAAAFTRGGYRTALYFTAHEYASLERTALWPLASRGFYFQRYDPAYRDAEAVLGDAARTLANRGDPVFVWAHLSDVHAPFLLRRERTGRAAAFEKSYAGQLAYLDSVLGPWIAQVTAQNHDLIWAVTSDHGESLGERGQRFHGSSLFDEQVRVPLLIGGPGVEPGTIATPVSNAALPATLLALAGAEMPRPARTLPLAPRQVDPKGQVLIVGRRERCAVVEGDHKLIASPRQGIVALYDLARDPAETTNLVNERRELARRLLRALPGLGCPFDTTGLVPILE